MAITFKYDVPGFVGSFAEGQSRKQKYGRELQERQQKYAFENQQRNQDRALNFQQRQADQQFQVDREFLQNQRAQRLQNNLLVDRQNERDQDAKLRQDAFELNKTERLRQEQGQDKRSILNSIPQIPAHANAQERLALNKLRDGIDKMVGKEFDFDDPNTRAGLNQAMEQYNSQIDALKQRTPSLNDQIEYLELQPGVKTPYWKHNGKPVEMPAAQPSQGDRRESHLRDQKAYSSTYAQMMSERKMEAGDEGTVTAPKPDEVLDRMDQEFTARESKINPASQAKPNMPQDPFETTPQQPTGAKPNPWAAITGAMGAIGGAMSQQSTPQPVTPTGQFGVLSQPTMQENPIAGLLGGEALPGAMLPVGATNQASQPRTAPQPVVPPPQPVVPPPQPAPVEAPVEAPVVQQPAITPPSLESARSRNIEPTTKSVGPMSVAPGRDPISGRPIEGAPIAKTQPAEPKWSELESSVKGQQRSQLTQFKDLYSKTDDPLAKQAISVFVSPQSTNAEIMMAVETLLKSGIDINDMFKSKKSSPARERPFFEPRGKM